MFLSEGDEEGVSFWDYSLGPKDHQHQGHFPDQFFRMFLAVQTVVTHEDHPHVLIQIRHRWDVLLMAASEVADIRYRHRNFFNVPQWRMEEPTPVKRSQREVPTLRGYSHPPPIARTRYHYGAN
jgi:hypothetical protein